MDHPGRDRTTVRSRAEHLVDDDLAPVCIPDLEHGGDEPFDGAACGAALSGITDAETTAELSQIIGETEVARRSTTVDADGRTSATHATHTQPLASAAGLRQLRPFEGVLVYGHLPPARIRLRPWFENPR